ncbi:MAG: DUF4956 domain-containing protein [Verrucomicrobiaceae bacterium]
MDPVIANVADFFDNINSASTTDVSPLEILGAMALSFVLNLVIGTLYKNTYKGTRYSQDYVHTLVIIGTVTTILIMVVKGNGAIAFGMFAAFSMIRFRRNLGQSRDLAFVFFAMATGMVVGAREYGLAMVTTLVTIVAIFILSRLDAFAPKRASHQLRIRVNNDVDFSVAFKAIFDKHTDAIEMISVESVQAGMMSELRYGLVLKEGVKVSDFMEEIQIACGNNRALLTTTQRDLDG